MGRSPCCDHENANVKKGPWTPEEDTKLKEYIEKNGSGNWRNLPKKAGLNRCGKSCRLRWTNYLRPDIVRGGFSMEEEKLIVHLHSVLGNKWSAIAARLPGRTDNEIKNYWNTHLRKKLLMMGIDPVTHRPRVDHNLNLFSSLPNLIAATNLSNLATNPLISNVIQLHRLQLLQTLLQTMANSSTTSTQNVNVPLGVQDLNQLALSSLGSDNIFQGCMPSNIVSIDGNGGYLDAPILNNGSCTSEFDSTPSLVAASSENCSADETRDQVNLSGSGSPNTTPFQPSGGLNVDDLDIDLDWKDILKKLSWSE